MNIIAKHLSRQNLKYPIVAVDTVCCFTGERIAEGVKTSDLLSDVFTDWAYIRHDSGYASVDAALCVADTIPGRDGKRNNSLRSYSYYASKNELRFLARPDILALLLSIPDVPFRLAVTYNNKKHTTYKTLLNTSIEDYTIATDLYSVRFNREHVMRFLPVIQRWYTLVPDKAGTAAQPTYFSKADILNGNAHYMKQSGYGLERYEEENEYLKPFRNTHIFELIVHLINKSDASH